MNPGNLQVQALKEKAGRLAGFCDRFSTWPETLRASLRLREAVGGIEFDRPEIRPVLIVFLGGTGVGKSHLFNLLLDRPNASEVSSAVRPCTSKPKLACSLRDRSGLQGFLDLDTVDLIEAPLEGVVLADCPDIDSVDQANRERTRRLVHAADIVVYVTDPEKRANFAIHQEVEEWSSRKRWYFVLTKADYWPKEKEEIRADFDKRLIELGFSPGPRTRFFISCLEPAQPEFQELRKTLLGRRSAELRALLPMDQFLGRLKHALDPALGKGIEANLARLREVEAQLDARLRNAYYQALRQSECADALKTLVREQVWQQAGERVGLFLWLPIWVRNRFAALGISWSLGQILMGRASLFGLVGLGLSSLLAMLRGHLPYKKVAAALGPAFRQEVESIRHFVRLKLEDLKIPLPTEEKEESEAHAQEKKGWGLMGVGAAFESIAAQFRKKQPEDEIIAFLRADLERLGERAGRKKFGPMVAVLGNLLPCVAVGDILYRAASGWIAHEYLPWNFYGMALLVFLGTLLPGFLWVMQRVWSTSEVPDLKELVEQVREPEATQGLRSARISVEELHREFHGLLEQTSQTRAILAEELDSPLFGEVSRKIPGSV
ncbi:MAG: hypothetical protein EXR99_15590 [Gemmataceae bacterium]|nr:hypothetical protein [Gemmataceae bacterium]